MLSMAAFGFFVCLFVFLAQDSFLFSICWFISSFQLSKEHVKINCLEKNVVNSDICLFKFLSFWMVLGMGRYNFQFYFACPILQMLTSKDANFIGYTFKKSDIMKSIGTSGLLLPELAIDFKFLIVYLVSHFGLLSSDQPDDQVTLFIVIWKHLKRKLLWLSMQKPDQKSIGMPQNIGESTDGR